MLRGSVVWMWKQSTQIGFEEEKNDEEKENLLKTPRHEKILLFFFAMKNSKLINYLFRIYSLSSHTLGLSVY